MIKQRPVFSLKPLTSISPSQFARMDDCALQIVLQKSLPGDVLPPGPMTYFGNAVHKIIELATKGELTDGPAITRRFEEELTKAETELTQKGWSYLVPLKFQITDFALRQKQAIKRALSLVPTHALTTGVAGGSFQIEERFESVNKKVVGYIDAIRQTDGGIEIVDYKSGQILDKTGLSVKQAYRQQLLLYAYLYWERHAVWPVRLVLIGLTGSPIEVTYRPDEAVQVYEHAIARLAVVNLGIETETLIEFSASSDSSACSYCAVRPVCPTRVLIPAFKGYTDLGGTIANVHEKQSTLLLQLRQSEQTYTVVNIPSTHLLTLTALLNQPVQIMTLRVVGENRYEWQGQTVLFWG